MSKTQGGWTTFLKPGSILPIAVILFVVYIAFGLGLVLWDCTGSLQRRWFLPPLHWVELSFPLFLFGVSVVGGGLVRVRSWSMQRKPCRGAVRGLRQIDLFMRRSARRLRALPLLLAICLPLWTLFNVWSLPAHDASVGAESSAMLGALPYSDAASYHYGASRILHHRSIDAWNARRPINASLLALRLYVSNSDLRIATLLQTLFLGLCMYYGAKRVALEFGRWSGLLFYAFLWGWSRPYIPSTLTEVFGISLGILAFSLLLEGVRRNRWVCWSFGMFLTGLANAARMGCLLLFPLLLLFTLWKHRQSPRMALASLAISVLALGFGFGVNTVLVAAYSQTSRSHVGSNFAHTLYGLSMGPGHDWTAYQESEELLALPEEALSKELYARALKRIKQNPDAFLFALGDNLRLSVVKIPAYMLHDGLSRPFHSPEGGSVLFLAAIALVLLFTLPLLPGFYGYWRRTKSIDDIAFWGFALLGISLSFSVIIRDAGWRAAAASYPWLAGVLSLAVANAVPVAYRPDSSRGRLWRVPCVLSILVFALAVLTPSLIQTTSPGYDPQPLPTPSDAVFVVRGGRALRSSSVLLGITPIPSLPSVPLPDAVARISSRSSEDMAALLAHALPDKDVDIVLSSAYDRNANAYVYALVPVEVLAIDDADLLLRGQRVVIPGKDMPQTLFHVASWEVIRD